MINYDIIKLGNPLLRLLSEPIPEQDYGSETLQNLSEILLQKMLEEHGLGLAAPQIGISKRAIVFGMPNHPINPIPYTTLFNPQFEPITDETEEDYEGCLSIGPLRGKVSRYKTIYYHGFDAEGQLIEREVSGLHARVVQHETDHLNGVVFLDKISDSLSLGFHDELISAGILTYRKTDTIDV